MLHLSGWVLCGSLLRWMGKLGLESKSEVDQFRPREF